MVKNRKLIERDPFWASYHGFDLIEKECRADGWYRGCAKDYVNEKEGLMRHKFGKYRNPCFTPEADCAMAGASRVWSPIRDSAILIHGPRGCCYQNTLFSPSFYWSAKGLHVALSTNLDRNDTILGYGEKLRDALMLIIEKYRPGFVGIITTCTTDIIGEDIEGPAMAVEEETGVPILTIHTPGFKWRVWSPSGDEAYIKLFERMEKSDNKEEKSLNLLNIGAIFDSWNEGFIIAHWIRSIGVKMNAIVPFGLSFRELLERFPRASLNIARCTGYSYQAMEYAEKTLGIPYLRLMKPISTKYTTNFLKSIGGFFGVEDAADAFIQGELKKFEDRLEKAKVKLKGKTIAITCGPSKNLGLAQLAAELGMKVVYLGPWKVDTMYHDTLKEFLDSTGQDPEIITEPSKYENEEMCSRIKPDIFFALSEERPGVLKTSGIPGFDTCSTRQLIGVEGAVKTAELFITLMRNPFYSKYIHYWTENFQSNASQKYLRETSALSLHRCQSLGNP